MSRIYTIVAIITLAGAAAADDDDEFFEKKIRPLLAEHCYACHSAGAKKLKGGLKLDSRDAALKGGETGPVIIPGWPEKSRLIEAVSYTNVDLQMPPKAKLSAAAIADLTRWVESGAAWPSNPKTTTENKAYAFDLAQRKREHWAWQPIQGARAPTLKAADPPMSLIDRFLIAKLEEKGLMPALAAEPRIILRRLSFDIVGLPPSPEMVAGFEKEYTRDKQRALEKAVDQLLASPQFGERWARHWLDLVRYAESRGHEFDYTVPNAYQYRDYVIRALNADVPYDQFAREHIAGDLLHSPRVHPKDGDNESILGTGFWYLGEQVHSPVDICQDRADRVDNQIDVMSKAFLGLTVACARCHDHKFDAISAKDYYALAGFIASSSYRLVPFEAMEHNRKIVDDMNKIWPELNGSFYTKVDADRDLSRISMLEDELECARAILQRQTSVPLKSNQKKLDPKRTALWVEHLRSAVKDRKDPFHRYACDVLGVAPIESRKAGPSQIVVDYQNCSPDEWLPDGLAFGAGPRQIGMRDSLTKELATEAAAIFKSGPRKAVGAEIEPGRLGRHLRAGRMLRTPTFDIADGPVHVRLRGTGLIYSAVEGHVMNEGPLHGVLVQTTKGGSEYRWHTIDLTPYKGRRAHLEFSPEGDTLAISRVIQSATPPADDDYDAPAEYSEWDGVKKPLAPAQQAVRLRGRFAASIAAVARDTPPPDSIDVHRVNWLRQHFQLFEFDLFDLGLVIIPGPAQQQGGSVDLKSMLTVVELSKKIRSESQLAPGIMDGSAVDERLFIRGNYKTPGEVVPRRFLEALVGPAPIKSDHGSGRLELARQMTDPAINPLFTRVFVNRVWHHLFGRGIVGSVDNFGVLGELPTYPELLDALAGQFAKDGFSLKRLIRQVVLTDAYQRSSRPSPEAIKVDPENLLLQHARVRRLEGEAIRDSILSVSGRLELKLYGPSVPVHLTDFQQGRGRPTSGPIDGNGRRSIYLSVRRNFLSPFLLAFDTPIPFSTVGRRTVSNVPAQSLILLNDPFVHQQADLWARRILEDSGLPEERLSRMYLTAFGRNPTNEEWLACRELATKNAWPNLAHVLINMKEFSFLE